MTAIVLADDHPLIRQGLRALLEAQAEFQVVGEADNGTDALSLVERLRPDMLIMDLMMPRMSGLEVIRQVRRRVPTTRVLVLSMHQGEAYVLEALRGGALGYVLKDAPGQELIQAVGEVGRGRRYLSPALTERALEVYVDNARTSEDIYETLTAREREVLALAAEGHSNPEIAERLFISPRTAETHRTNLMRKLGLHTQTDLLRFALRRGLLPIEEWADG